LNCHKQTKQTGWLGFLSPTILANAGLATADIELTLRSLHAGRVLIHSAEARVLIAAAEAAGGPRVVVALDDRRCPRRKTTAPPSSPRLSG